MNELKKIKDVMKKVIPEAPDEVMLVLDGSTGQNAFEQAKQFAAVTQISSMAITKLDGTAKGGVVIGISDQLKVPVKYIGDWIDEDDDEYGLVMRKWKEADSLFVERMTEFMQDREYSPVFDTYIHGISRRILFSRNKVQREKAAKLLAKAPKVENAWDNEYIYLTDRFL